jgi:MFS transporter, DHA2 family, methylenomycin A resistance protein
VGGGLIGASGYALLGIFGISDHATFLDMLPGLALVPIGMGFAVPAMTTSILSGVERHQAGTASAVLNTARQVGGATGVAVFGAIVASGTGVGIMSGVRSALEISAVLLLASSALAFWSKAGVAPVAQARSGVMVMCRDRRRSR